MVALSTLILLVSAFVVLTYIDNTVQTNNNSSPVVFADNFSDEIETTNNDEIIISAEGQETLLEHDGWVQILDQEGYVTQAFNTPDHAAEHYSPTEIRSIRFSSSYRPDYFFDVGRTVDNIDYLVAIPAGSWNQYTLEIDQQMIQQFAQIMIVFTIVIFLIMGFIFSRRIARPVTQIIDGVKSLSNGNYKINYKEKGLYKSIFVSLNQLADRLKTSEIEREKTKEQREKWVSNISHDLKTPLSTIKGYSEILSAPDYELSSAEIKKYSKSIYEKSIYMEDMIEELRLNEKLMHNGSNLKKEKGNLTSFVRKIILEILNHPDYTDRNVEFHSEDEGLIFPFDKSLMKRAIENLVYNALIHNEDKTKVMITISKVNEEILIQISDDGYGMTQEDLDKLFNRYYRGTNTINHKGSGLGMSIAKEVIEAHGGEIKVTSEINKGTQINLKL
jgi:signal transduction histidine kinase